MTSTDRLNSERAFHDRQAGQRADYFARHQQALVFEDEAYLDHETWLRPAVAKLGALSGRSVLDYGCGHGMAAVVFARAGANVTGFDLSAGYVAEAQRRAGANGVAAEFLMADAHQLPFASASFDAVWGAAILHHLDLKVAGTELRRVLRPGGVAVFCEPWGGNPAVRLARACIPYVGKEHTRDERALRHADLAPLRPLFARVEVQGFQLLGMARRLWRQTSRPGNLLDRLDRRLLQRVPALGNWCRYVVVTLYR